MSLADRHREARLAKGLSQEEEAELVGMSQQGIFAIEQGQSEHPRKLAKIAKVLGTTEAYLLYGLDAPNMIEKSSILNEEFVQKIPILDWQLAKLGRNAVAKSHGYKDIIPILTDSASSKSFALYVKGDAMQSDIPSPRNLLEGEIIIINPFKSYSHGNIVIASIKGLPEAICRNYIEEGGIAYLKPFNSEWEKMKIDENIKICGVVVGKYMLL